MKSKILSLIITIVMMGTAIKTFANNNFTVLNEKMAINKIEVHGNVELYISDADADQIKVYNKYYAENALVQTKNGVLRIASYKNEKLVVWVSSTDLRSVSAYDNSVVRSFGKLSKIEFNIDLHDRAEANLNLDSFIATVTVKDNAKATMTGSAQELTLSRDIQSNLKNTAFIAAHIYETKPSYNAAVDSRVIGM